ncbi:MAG: GNAT family N-acetyltransferase [Firmicutes bacterium]|nr:GNAT family N-acetyltransferase [Bacillota bacterium]
MVEFRTLRREELNQWFDHCAQVFTQGEYTDRMRLYFMRHWYNDSRRRLSGIQVAVIDGEIASTIRVFLRNVYLQGQITAMGGIGEVSTKPQFRRQGLSSKLLEMSIAYMERQGLVVSALGTGVPNHYARYGWESIRSYRAEAQVTAARDQDCRLLDWDDDWELNQVATVYDEYARGFNGMIVRDDLYWRRWVRSEAGRGWVLLRGDQVVAYLIANVDDNKVLQVQDFATLEPDSDSFARLVAHGVWSFGLESAKVAFPAAIRPPGLEVEYSVRDSLMYRINDPGMKPRLAGQSLEEWLHGGQITPEETVQMVAAIDAF